LLFTEGFLTILYIFLKKMNGNILLAILSLLIVSNGLRISQHEAVNGESILVGGYSPTSVTNLSDDAKQVDQFIRDKHTDL
jgi:hypothetical protein